MSGGTSTGVATVNAASSSGGLSGIAVVDASIGLPGPVATRWMAELGADVLKVEPPSGDPTRKEQPAGFASWNRSKRATTLDPRRTADRSRLDDWLSRADVFVHDWTPNQAAALGLHARHLATSHPHLIVASVTAYPVGHPDAERYGDELLVQARVGAMDEQEALRDGPMFIRLPFASWGAAYLLAGGIAARLFERERTGVARSIHTSLLQGALVPAALYWQRAECPPPWMLNHTLPKIDEPPHLTIFECADGRWLQLMGPFVETELLLPFLDRVDAIDLFGGRPTRENRHRWAEVFAQQTVDEWTALLWPVGALCMPVLEPGEVLGLEQTRRNRYAVEVDDPIYGPSLQAGFPFDIEPPASVVGAAPSFPSGNESETIPARRHTTARTSRSTEPPLAGVRVVDFGSYVAGPIASQCLADLGADVIKVEPLDGEKGREINQFTGCQRGKRSLALNLRHPRSRDVLVPLVGAADVVLHNMRLGPSRAMGIDEESIRAINPRVVFGHSTGYGSEGPWSEIAAFDPTGFALSGWAQGISGPGRRPSWLRMSVMDAHTGLAGFAAVTLALFVRARTGHAGRASTSLLGVAAMSTSETLLFGPDLQAADLRPVDAEQTGLDPWYRIYQVGDGWIAVSARTELERLALGRLLQVPVEQFENAFRSRGLQEALQLLDNEGVRAEVVALDHRDAFFEAELANDSGLVARSYGTPYGWFENPGGFWSDGRGVFRSGRPIPGVGQHTAVLLQELGFTSQQIAQYVDDGVVGVPAADVPTL